MEDELLRKILDRMSADTRQLLDWEAHRLLQLKREAGVIDMTPSDLDCQGHDHNGEDR